MIWSIEAAVADAAVTTAFQHGMLRVFGAVSDETRPRETFFQAGFYSYTRETWYAASRAPLAPPSGQHPGHPARSSDAHDLFRFYVATTPHAVQRAEQLTVEDFDIGRRAGAFDPPYLVSGNPLTLRREEIEGLPVEPQPSLLSPRSSMNCLAANLRP